ncbi:MAG: FCD domain-containing protein [Thiolinea sp.]
MRPDELKDQRHECQAMREVLMRLTQEQLLEQPEQRGFLVPGSLGKTLGELMDLRILLECEGARQSIAHGDLEWEARLNAAHHKLEHIESKMRTATDLMALIPIWTRVDWEFHDTLLSACPSDTLRQVHRQIYERSRQQVATAITTPVSALRPCPNMKPSCKRRSTAMWPPVRPRFITICKPSGMIFRNGSDWPEHPPV